MRLFRPAWDSKNAEKAVKAANKLKDETKLARVAKEAQCWQARKAAVEKLTDQNILAGIACTANSIKICLKAVEKLTEQILLAKVGTTAQNANVRLTAGKKVTDPSIMQKIYLNIAQSDCDFEVRAEAADLLADRQFADTTYARIVIGYGDKLWTNRDDKCLAIVDKMVDQTTIADVVCNVCNHNILQKALEKITDQSLLIKIGTTAKFEETCLAVAKKITDPMYAQIIFTNIAKSNSILPYREDAADLLIDRILANTVYADLIIKECGHHSFYKADKALSILNKMTDQIAIANVVKNAYCIRFTAFEMLNDDVLITDAIHSLSNDLKNTQVDNDVRVIAGETLIKIYRLKSAFKYRDFIKSLSGTSVPNRGLHKDDGYIDTHNDYNYPFVDYTDHSDQYEDWYFNVE